MPRPLLNLSPLLLAVLMAAGCTEKFDDYAAFMQEPRPLVTLTDYRVMPPDVVRIESKFVSEFNNQSQMVRPDGKITLPLVGTIYVAGKTPEQISKELTQMARKYYENAEVSVIVQYFNSKKVLVFGEVTTPGAYPYDGSNTVLGMLAQAQPTRLADNTRIRVVRPNANGEMVHKMTINLDDMVQNGLIQHDAVLEEGDILYIPPNPLAAVGLGLQQLFLPIQPAASIARGSSTIQETFTGVPSFTTPNGR